jgi:hypothetical protein
MFINRYGEDSRQHFRSQRLFSENGQWYFDTREGHQIGPYYDLKDVKNALAAFISQRLLVSRNGRSEELDYLPGRQDGIEHLVEELYEYYSIYQQNGQTAAVSWAIKRVADLERSRDPSLLGVSARIDALHYAMDLEED